MSFKSFLVGFFAAIAAFFLSIPTASAHRLSVSIDVNEHEIEIRAFFGGRSPCRTCRITATDNEGNEVFSGRTDKSGLVTFRPDNLASDLAITARDSMGHRGTGRISAERLKVLQTDESIAEADTEETASTADNNCRIDKDEISALIRKEVAKQIRASKHLTGTDDPHKSFEIRDLIAGLGFIFGLSGLILAASKKRKS